MFLLNFYFGRFKKEEEARLARVEKQRLEAEEKHNQRLAKQKSDKYQEYLKLKKEFEQ